ncbi:TPA: hypothetical protein NIF78_006298 [Pseudomonas aeruginosa]|nr:hypothetical protein [Pseudomonas aeruginosa]HCF4892869.1 hypothetical protein [Pseudomonas aeruginosa]HCF4933300.1 hypothetical protein [Pseudomonas aeruginosa]HCF5105332.1 hypothetical protein [Pseudomonas aeruginosa]
MSALRLATQDGAPVPTGADLHDHFHAPAGESKEDRERRLARDRKRAQRAREAQAKLKAEAVKVPLTLYGGSVAALAEVCKAGGFEEAEEALTLMVHGASDLSKRDPKAFAEFLAPVFAALAVAGADLSRRDRHAFAQLIAPPSHQVASDADA